MLLDLLNDSKKSSIIIQHTLGMLHHLRKNFKDAEKYYLGVIDSGDNNALRSLGILYSEQSSLYYEQKEYKKAEEYCLKAIARKDNKALNNLSLLYFEQSKNITESIKLSLKSYSKEKNIYNTHTLAITLLWQENFTESYNKFLEFLKFENISEYEGDTIFYITLLIAKEQYYKAKEFMEMPEYQFKERYKSIWYALMTHMSDEFPYEIKKMGSELRRSVDEILEEIDRLRDKYKIE